MRVFNKTSIHDLYTFVTVNVINETGLRRILQIEVLK